MLMSFWARLSEGLQPVRARHQRGQDIGHGVGGAAVASVPDLPKAVMPGQQERSAEIIDAAAQVV